MVDVYRTSNIYLAAFIMACKVPIRDAVVDGDKVRFLFDLTYEENYQLKTEFFSGRGIVSAKQYADKLKACKEFVNAATRKHEHDDPDCICMLMGCTNPACKGECGCERCQHDYQDYGHC